MAQRLCHSHQEWPAPSLYKAGAQGPRGHTQRALVSIILKLCPDRLPSKHLALSILMLMPQWQMHRYWCK